MHPTHFALCLAMQPRNRYASSVLTYLFLLQIEDRPIVKEIKTYVREHHPVEKEFVVETRPTGMSVFLMFSTCTLLQFVQLDEHSSVCVSVLGCALL